MIYDKDGTLLDYMPHWEDAFVFRVQKILEYVGLSKHDLRVELMNEMGLDPETGKIVLGGNAGASGRKTKHNNSVNILRRYGVCFDEADAIVKQSFAEEHSLFPIHEYVKAVRGVEESLLGLRKQGVRIAIATSDQRDTALKSLKSAGISSLIDYMVTGSDSVQPKPAGDMVEKVGEALNVNVSKIAVVGDTSLDMNMARNAAVRLRVAVLTGSGCPAQLKELADIVLPSARSLHYCP